MPLAAAVTSPDEFVAAGTAIAALNKNTTHRFFIAFPFGRSHARSTRISIPGEVDLSTWASDALHQRRLSRAQGCAKIRQLHAARSATKHSTKFQASTSNRGGANGCKSCIGGGRNGRTWTRRESGVCGRRREGYRHVPAPRGFRRTEE